MKSLLYLTACALTLAISTATARDLDTAGENVVKKESRLRDIGPVEPIISDTVIFYAFGDQAAVLQLNIAGSGGKFAVSGRVRLFAEGTDSETIGLWIHNQNSDALFPDVPEPVAIIPLAADAFKVLESKPKGDGNVHRRQNDETFQDYDVKIQIADVKSDKGFTLKGFTVDTSVFVKVGPPA